MYTCNSILFTFNLLTYILYSTILYSYISYPIYLYQVIREFGTFGDRERRKAGQVLFRDVKCSTFAASFAGRQDDPRETLERPARDSRGAMRSVDIQRPDGSIIGGRAVIADKRLKVKSME